MAFKIRMQDIVSNCKLCNQKIQSHENHPFGAFPVCGIPRSHPCCRTPARLSSKSQDGQLVAIANGIDGFDSTFFVLQSEVEIAGNFPHTIDGARIDYSEDGACLVISANGVNRVTMKLAGAGNCAQSAPTYEGYGLLRNSTPPVCEMYLSAFLSRGTLPPVSELSCGCLPYRTSAT